VSDRIPLATVAPTGGGQIDAPARREVVALAEAVFTGGAVVSGRMPRERGTQ